MGKMNLPSSVKSAIGAIKSPITNPIPKIPLNIPILNKIVEQLAIPKFITIPKPPPIQNIKNDRGFEDIIANPKAVQSTKDIIVGTGPKGNSITAMSAIKGGGIPQNIREDKLRRLNIESNRGFDDEVIEDFGLPILSGGGASDRALILAGEAIGPVTIMNDGTRVTSSGIVDNKGRVIRPDGQDVIPELPMGKPSVGNFIPLAGGDPIGNSDISFAVASTPPDAEVFIDNLPAGVRGTPTVLTFTKKELLDNKKIITVKRAGYNNNGLTYTIFSKMKLKTINKQVLVDEGMIPIQGPPIRTGGRPEQRGFDDNVFMDRGLPIVSGGGVSDRALIAAGEAQGPVSFTKSSPRYKTISTTVQSYAITYMRRGGGLPNDSWEILGTDTTRPKLNFPLSQIITKDEPVDIPISLPELLILTDGDSSSIDKYTAVITNNQSVKRIGGDTFKSKVPFSIVLQAKNVNEYRIKNFRIHKGSITDDETIGFETLDVNELTLDIGGPTTVAIEFEKVEKLLTPSVKLSGTQFKYNIGDPQKIALGYDTINAANIRFQLANTTIDRTDEAGIFEISKTMFKAGVGQYTGYIVPSNAGFGDGTPVKFHINVVNETQIEGPDIVNISYPSLIKGADFKGYDVNFTVQYQSINTNYVNIYLGDKSKLYGKFSPNQSVDFNMLTVLKKLEDNYKETAGGLKFQILLIPINTSTDKEVAGKTEVLEIIFDKSSIELPRKNVIDELCNAFEFDLNLFDDETSKYLTHLAHFGDGNNKLIANWETDDVTFAEWETDTLRDKLIPNRIGGFDALVLKLYEPLGKEVQPNQELWISKVITQPIIDDVSIVDDSKQVCIPLKGPNFGLNLCGSPADTGFEIIDELVSSGSTSSAKLINTFVSQSGIDTEKLDIEYVSSSYTYIETEYGYSVDGTVSETYRFDNFSHFGSSEERAKNFNYKVSLLEVYSASLDTIDNRSGSSTGSLSIVRERESIVKKQNDILVNFDGYETFLYDSTSSLAFPKESDGITLESTGSTNAVAWYDTLIISSSAWDKENENYLVNNIPEYIRNDDEQEDFILFLDMIGHHFDILWAYTNSLSANTKIEEKKRIGISDDMLKHVLKNYSWIPHSSQSTKKLWEYVLGYKDSEQSSQIAIKGKQYENTIWRRILNNLPYLLKHKGTRRGLSAVLSTYGIPSSLLTIMEFGGPRQETSQTSTFTFDDRTSAVVMPNDEQNTKLLVDWNLENDISSSSAVEVRFKTSNQHSQSLITNEPYWNIKLEHQHGNIGRLNFSSSFGSIITESGSLFNDEFTNLVVNTNFDSASTEDVSASIELIAQQDFQGRIRTAISSSTDFTSSINSYFSGSQLSIGEAFTGSLDEFRIWSSALSASVIEGHSLLPDKTSGNHVSSSTEDLEFRLDFENPENLNVSTSISNVVVGGSYNVSYATASGFSTNTSYPYHFEVYDRQVTAKVPAMGFGPGDKFRFESSSLTGNLSYKQRVTKKAFDRAPQDSNRLGIFLSPSKEINMDIIKSLPDLSIDDYIGEPGHQYKDTYPDLNELRDYVFARYTLNIHEYINLIKYIDKSMFETIKQMIPARTKLVDGLLIEPHYLERSKEKRNKPVATLMTSSEGSFDVSRGSVVTVDLSILQEEGLLELTSSVEFEATNLQYETLISETSNVELDSSLINYDTSIDYRNTTELESSILRNSGSDMDGGLSIPIDTVVDAPESASFEEASLVGTYVGTDDYSISNIGFGLGPISNGYAQRIYRDKFNNYKKEDVRVWIVKKEKKFKETMNIDGLDKSMGTQVSESVSRFTTIVTLVNSASNEYWTSSLSGMVGTVDPDGTVIQVSSPSGYLPNHYEGPGDSKLPTGLQNLFFKGSKQTQATTLDGTPPVEIFTTNPNTLKVSDSGRGSGEPILEVE